LMSAIDSSISNTVLPVIARDFHASIGVIEWVLMAYLVAMTSLLLTAGRIGDLVGYRQVFLTGFGVFVVASAICGAAPNELVLIVFRAIQGSAAAMLSASGIVLVTQAFPPAERGRGIGLNVATVYFGLTIGPAVGGLLAGALGWRAVFYVNVPVGIIGIVLGLRILPRLPLPERRSRFAVATFRPGKLPGGSELLGVATG